MASIDSTISTGRRLYIRTAYGEPIVAELKALGAHWDSEAKAWWITPAKRKEVEELLVGADRAEDEARDRGERAPKEDPHLIRLTGKGRYRGREYYAGAVTKDGLRVRLLTLPDKDGNYLDFWAPCAFVEETKRYEPRQVWDGCRYSGKTVTKYTTLGSIADFLAEQKDPQTARGRCSECDEWGSRGETCQQCHEGTHC